MVPVLVELTFQLERKDINDIITQLHKFICENSSPKKYRVIGNGRNWCKKAREVRARGERWWQCWCREGGRFKISLRDGVKWA